MAARNHETTLKFIEKRIDKAKLFNGKKNSAFNEYKNLIDEINIPITPIQAKAKWQNLITKYKSLKKPPTGAGVEMDEDTAANWEYFQILDEFMSPRHTITPPIIIASLETSSGLHVIEDHDDNEIIEEISIEPCGSSEAPQPKIRKQSATYELINIAREGNKIMDRAVTAFETYVNFKMTQG